MVSNTNAQKSDIGKMDSYRELWQDIEAKAVECVCLLDKLTGKEKWKNV